MLTKTKLLPMPILIQIPCCLTVSPIPTNRQLHIDTCTKTPCAEPQTTYSELKTKSPSNSATCKTCNPHKLSFTGHNSISLVLFFLLFTVFDRWDSGSRTLQRDFNDRWISCAVVRILSPLGFVISLVKI